MLSCLPVTYGLLMCVCMPTCIAWPQYSALHATALQAGPTVQNDSSVRYELVSLCCALHLAHMCDYAHLVDGVWILGFRNTATHVPYYCHHLVFHLLGFSCPLTILAQASRGGIA